MVSGSVIKSGNPVFTNGPDSPANGRGCPAFGGRAIVLQGSRAPDVGDSAIAVFRVSVARCSVAKLIAAPAFGAESARFVDDLLAHMTLEEKLGQVNLDHSSGDPALETAIVAGRVGGILAARDAHRLQTLATERSRLGIPLLLTASSVTTSLSPWGLAASWDEDLLRDLGAAAASDARRRGYNCIAAPHTRLAPHGPDTRAQIAACEPLLAARLAAAFAFGATTGWNQGEAPALAIASTDTVAHDQQQRWAVSLLQSGTVAAIDCAALDPDLASRAGFAGLLVAECRRIAALIAARFNATSTRSVLEAAERAIGDGDLSGYDIDRAVRGVLTVKHALGLFHDREQFSHQRGAAGGDASVSEAVGRTMVLLRNEAGLLPLSPVSDRVLVVGAADGAGGLCCEALARGGIGHSAAPGLALRAKGASWAEPIAGDHFALSLTRDAAQRADFVIVALDDRHFGEPSPDSWAQPTAATRAMLAALSPTGSRMAALIATEAPIDLGDTDRHFAAVLQCWKPLPGFVEALGDILSGRSSPQGRLPVTAGRFEFGHGLGFGESVFSAYALQAAGDHVAATLRVRNAGSFAARETVQVYVRGEDGELRLAAFQHVRLAPGEDVAVRFELGAEALATPGSNARLELATGLMEILIGKNIGRLLSAQVAITPALARAILNRDYGSLRLAAG